MKGVLVREIRKKDFKAFKILYAQTIQNEFPEYSPNIRKYFISEFKQDVLTSYIKIGAFNNEKLVGYILAGKKPYGGILNIDWLVVMKTYQRRGIGQLLLEEIDKSGTDLGAHAIHLEVSHKNIPFYTLCGYKEYGFDEKGYFGTDNYLMKKELGEPDEKHFLG